MVVAMALHKLQQVIVAPAWPRVWRVKEAYPEDDEVQREREGQPQPLMVPKSPRRDSFPVTSGALAVSQDACSRSMGREVRAAGARVVVHMRGHFAHPLLLRCGSKLWSRCWISARS